MVKALKLFQPKRTLPSRPRERRGSRHERGYDYEWSKAAAAYAKVHPTCEECERGDRIVPMDVVDHKIPVTARPDLRLDPKNRWSLCHDCHNGLKRRMEAYAAKLGDLEILAEWCDDPTSRPAAFAKVRVSRQKGMVV